MRRFANQLDRIEKALTGDPQYGQRGLVFSRDDHERRLVAIEQERRGVIGYIAGAVGVIVLVWAMFTQFFKK